MTKDDYVSPSGIGPLFDAGLAAGRDAALADTLGMLEALAKLGDDPVFKGLQVNYCPNADTFTYFNHRPRSIAFQRDRDISRAEAEALLKGDAADADA